MFVNTFFGGGGVDPRQGQLYLNANHPLNDGLVALFHSFDGGMRDIGPGRYPATLVDASGDITREQTAFGKTHLYEAGATADRFDLGTIGVAHPLAFVGATEFSINIWMNFHDAAGSDYPRVIDKSNGGSAANGWYVDVDSNGSNNNSMELNIDGVGRLSGNDFVINNETHMYTVTLGLGRVYWYRDGVLFHDQAHSSWVFPSVSTSGAIGHWNHSSLDRRFSGNQYVISIWNKRLINAEIQALAHADTRWRQFSQPSNTRYFIGNTSISTDVTTQAKALTIAGLDAVVTAGDGSVNVSTQRKALSIAGLNVVVTAGAPGVNFGPDFEGKNINDSASSIADPETSTPDITLVPYKNTTEGQSGSTQTNKFWFYAGNITNADATTPVFEIDFTDQWGSMGGVVPQWTDDITDLDSWQAFDNHSLASSIVTFSNNSAFTSDTIYFALGRVVTHSIIEAFFESYATNPYMHKPQSVKSYAGTSPWAHAAIAATTDDNGLSIPAQEHLACRITDLQRYPADGQGKRKIILLTGAHGGEDVGGEVFLRAIEALLSASQNGDAAQQAFWRIVRDYDIYCYGTYSPARYRHHTYGYSNVLQAGADYQPNAHCDDTRPFSQPWHEDLFEAMDIDLPNGTAHVLLDYHAQGSNGNIGEIWGDTVDPALVDYEGFVDNYFTGVNPDNAQNDGAIRSYFRTNFATTHSYAVETAYSRNPTIQNCKDFGSASVRALDDLFAADMAQTAVATKVTQDVTSGESLTGLDWQLFCHDDRANGEPPFLFGTNESTDSSGIIEIITTQYLEIGEKATLVITDYAGNITTTSYNITGGVLQAVAV